MAESEVLRPGEGKKLALPGATITFKIWGPRSPGNHDVAEFIAEPGFRGPRPHVHRRHEELFYVLEGEFDFLVGDTVVRVGPGTFLAVPPGVVHDFRNAGATKARWLGIPCPGGLDAYFEAMTAMFAAGEMTESAVRDLRLNYDTDEVDLAWGEPS